MHVSSLAKLLPGIMGDVVLDVAYSFKAQMPLYHLLSFPKRILRTYQMVPPLPTIPNYLSFRIHHKLTLPPLLYPTLYPLPPIGPLPDRSLPKVAPHQTPPNNPIPND